jgi:hypothetical protein
MKKTILLLTFLFCAKAFAQTQVWSTIAVGSSLPANVPRVGYMFFRTSDSTTHISTGKIWELVNSNFTSSLPNSIEFLGTTLSGAADSTMHDVPSKQLATGDSAFFDFRVSKKFTALDSIVIYTVTPSTTGDSMALSIKVKKINGAGSTSAAYNAATIDTTDMGGGSTLIVFRLTAGFGTLSAGVGEIVGYVKRTACTNNMTRKGLIRRVIFYKKD